MTDFAMWIPVSEKLPTSDGKFLVTVKNKGKPHIETAIYNSQACVTFFTDKWSIRGVIAWRQLPTPYKPNKDGE